MTMITPSYLGETIEYSSLHACRSTLEDPTLSKAHFDAVHELRTAQSSPGTAGASQYGAKALIYSLWGNGSLSLCPLTPSTIAASVP